MSYPYLLCKPTHWDVRYKINPWMDPALGSNSARALLQWQNLYDTLAKLDVSISLIDQLQAQPDMVFTANAGLVRGETFIPSRFRYKERQGEEPAFIDWFERRGYKIVHLKRGCFEGEGDALFSSPDKLFVGYEFRTDSRVIEEVGEVLSVRTIPCHLTDDRFYHLDTCFCPINESVAMFVPQAFTKDSIRRMEQEIELVEVPEVDALKFACNAVVVGTNVVLPHGCAHTESILRERGYSPYGVELGEYLKGGGSAKCLSLKLST